MSNGKYTMMEFCHDGGEMIFNLPNGLQGYMLVNGKDVRIDAGPIDVVRDSQETTGTPQIVNGLSWAMACHDRGIKTVADTIRTRNVCEGRRVEQSSAIVHAGVAHGQVARTRRPALHARPGGSHLWIPERRDRHGQENLRISRKWSASSPSVS